MNETGMVRPCAGYEFRWRDTGLGFRVDELASKEAVVVRPGLGFGLCGWSLGFTAGG